MTLHNDDAASSTGTVIYNPDTREKVLLFFGFRDKDGVKHGAMHPDSTFQTCWGVLNIVFLIYIAFVLPVRTAWDTTLGCNWNLVSFEIVVDVFFILDILVHFFTGYRAVGRLETNLRVTSVQYCRTWLAFDIVVSVPTTIIQVAVEGTCGGTGISALMGVKMLRMMGLIRVVRAVKMFKIELFHRVQANYFVVSLVKLACFVLFIMHIAACAFWFVKQNDPNLLSWESENELGDATFVDLYVTSLYFAATTLTTVGYGDIKAENSLERGYCFFLMLIGTCMFATVISCISNLIDAASSRRKAHEQEMIKLSEFYIFHNVDEHIQHRINAYFRHKNEVDSFKTQLDTLVNVLPIQLGDELRLQLVESIVGGKEGPFGSAPKEYLMALFNFLKPVKTSPNEVLFWEGEVANALYFVYQGCIQLSLADGSQRTVSRGSENIIGERGVLREGPAVHCGHAVSPGYTTLYSVSKVAFMELTSAYPHFLQQLRKFAEYNTPAPQGREMIAMSARVVECAGSGLVLQHQHHDRIQPQICSISDKPQQQAPAPLPSRKCNPMNDNAARTIQRWWSRTPRGHEVQMELLRRSEASNFGENLLSRLGQHLSPSHNNNDNHSHHTSSRNRSITPTRRRHTAHATTMMSSNPATRASVINRRRRSSPLRQLASVHNIPTAAAASAVTPETCVDALKTASDRLLHALAQLKLEEMAAAVEMLKGGKEGKLESAAAEVMRAAETIAQAASVLSTMPNLPTSTTSVIAPLPARPVSPLMTMVGSARGASSVRSFGSKQRDAHVVLPTTPTTTAGHSHHGRHHNHHHHHSRNHHQTPRSRVSISSDEDDDDDVEDVEDDYSHNSHNNNNNNSKNGSHVASHLRRHSDLLVAGANAYGSDNNNNDSSDDALMDGSTKITNATSTASASLQQQQQHSQQRSHSSSTNVGVLNCVSPAQVVVVGGGDVELSSIAVAAVDANSGGGGGRERTIVWEAMV